MRSLRFLLLGFGTAVVSLLAASGTPAQDEKIDTKAVAFDSADGVELQGTLYKSKNGANSPCVILLHDPAKLPTVGDWDGLAITMARKGFTVLRFDFRGQGKSFVVEPKSFWTDAVNVKYMRSLALKRPQPSKVEYKDFARQTDYFPHLANDVMGARIALDKLNDAGEVNTSSVYLVGASEAAVLGMIFMTAEWSRPQVMPPAVNLLAVPPVNQVIPPGTDWSGKDIAGAVWLSARMHRSMSEANMKNLIARFAIDIREKNPMRFIVGDKDRIGILNARFFAEEMLVANPGRGDPKLTPVPFTDIKPVKDSKLIGEGLLGQKNGTEELILEQLERIEKDRKNVIKTPARNYTKPPLLMAQYYGAFR